MVRMEAQKEKEKKVLFVAFFKHSVWVFFVQHKLQSEYFHIFYMVLKFCEAEAINMCREIKLQKKKT